MPSRPVPDTFEPDQPRSQPLQSFEELKNWQPGKNDAFNVATVPLQPRVNQSGPRLLVAHDMAGGYKEDLYIQGSNYQTIYNSQYLHYVDTFIYFSHSRVAIPPVNWTNTCHRNGVKMLGTLIVEGDAESELEKLLHGPPALFEDADDPMRLWSPFFADKLVEVAKYYKFDGWLMNIEVPFYMLPTPPPCKSRDFVLFIQYFTEKMHAEIPGSVVLWYDSLTMVGEVDWQNRLTPLNEPFFEACDGIFLNYWWKESYPDESVRLAERRGRNGADVYFGTDVWGRHTFGGGGFRSANAVEVASLAGTSSALFAPAWTYEFFEKQQFDKLEELFWLGGPQDAYPEEPKKPEKPEKPEDPPSPKPDEKMYGSDRKKGIAEAFGVTARIPQGTSFATWFDRGYGSAFYLNGNQVMASPWSQLSHQGILPNVNYRTPFADKESSTALGCSMSDTDAYIGGTCLLLRLTRDLAQPGQYPHDGTIHYNIPLYQLAIDISEGCSIQLIYKPLAQSNSLKIQPYCEFSLDGLSFQANESQWQKESITVDNGWTVLTINLSRPALSGAATRLTVKHLGLSVAFDTSELKESGLDLMRIGYLGVAPLSKQEHLNVLTNLRWEEVRWQDASHFSGTIAWDTLFTADTDNNLPGIGFVAIYYGVNRFFLGTAFTSMYRLSGMEIDASTQSNVYIEAYDVLGKVIATETLMLPAKNMHLS
ncbi:glycosyl hydrolase family 85-domain-containing protein [Radiomyces spectabilis]|uniref:glycosyl hydrolase family 85-domain-containing protein n=1 Tax=Radiomyces spectabilis TaxID=64574 RepID=UPI00221EF3C3|nr:glycosyl hydrolase family 85-domain-containing protein [Radiomyces spectabilis]KAI8371465.1 glycosyl hydrolase family 85-domain-containing protein [Radiomyces spectabilis]